MAPAYLKANMKSTTLHTNIDLQWIIMLVTNPCSRMAVATQRDLEVGTRVALGLVGFIILLLSWHQA